MLFGWLNFRFCDFARQAYFSIRHKGKDFAIAFLEVFVVLGLSSSTQWKTHSKNNSALRCSYCNSEQSVTASGMFNSEEIVYIALSKWCPNSHENISWHLTRYNLWRKYARYFHLRQFIVRNAWNRKFCRPKETLSFTDCWYIILLIYLFEQTTFKIFLNVCGLIFFVAF